jgi:hypothetical protein
MLESYLRAFPVRAQAFEVGKLFHGRQCFLDRGVHAASSSATETRRPKGFKISCNVSRVGLPLFERIL